VVDDEQQIREMYTQAFTRAGYEVRAAESGEEALDILKGRIGYLHCKNCLALGDAYSYSVSVCDGDIDYRRLLARLVAQGFRGPLCVEYCGSGDPTPRLERDRAYIGRLIEECQGSCGSD
jgi:sugar phosphate isomerase/epimerase